MAAIMNSQQALEVILAMENGSGLPSIVCTSSDSMNQKKMTIPVRDICQKIHLRLSYLVSEIVISSNYTITSWHFENLYPCDIIIFAFLAKMLPYSHREFYKLFTDIYFQILVFDLDIVA